MKELKSIDIIDIRTILMIRRTDLQRKLKNCKLTAQRSYILQIDRVNELLSKLEN